MNNKKLKDLAIKRYALKIAWADLQPKHEKVSEVDMSEDIGLGWYADDCPYCDTYVQCEGCPLKTGNFNSKETKQCCGGLWLKMAESKTWGAWVKNARKVQEFIKNS
jgi:hypothetical protein